MVDNTKKILVIDDSALMRRIICDIIGTDNRFRVQDMAANGLDAVELLKVNTYDAIILDILMPKMDGIAVLKEMNKLRIDTNVIVFSSVAKAGTAITLQALELGAMDFIHKPQTIPGAKTDSFIKEFIDLLDCATKPENHCKNTKEPDKNGMILKQAEATKKSRYKKHEKQIVAIASSTGGPKALHAVIPFLPKELDAPVLIVQHMPAGFTASLAQRLNDLSQMQVEEAEEGTELLKGHVYLAKGGKHMMVMTKNGRNYLSLSDGPSREGVKPCANNMYESLSNSDYDRVICVVLTGMGADGTEGIQNLSKNKEIYVIAQEQSTCAVYGMPRSIVNTGIVNQIEPIDAVATAILTNVGVK